MTGVLADGGGFDAAVSEGFIALALLLGWVGLQRLRGRSFRRLPKPVGAAAAALALASAVLAGVLPALINPGTASVRPSSPARIEILAPAPG